MAKKKTGSKANLAPYTKSEREPTKWKHDLYEGPRVNLARHRNAAAGSGDLRTRLKPKADTMTFAEERALGSRAPSGRLGGAAAAGAAAPAVPTAKVIVTNLQLSVTEKDMKDLFETVGPVLRVTMTTKGEERTAHVTFKQAADATAAQHKFHNIPLDGSRMNITIAAAETKVSLGKGRVPVLARLGLPVDSRS